MKNRKFISIDEVVLKIYRDLNIEQERDNYLNIIEWIGEAIDLIGYYEIYERKETEIEVKDFKALLPCDYIHYIQIDFFVTDIKSNPHHNQIFSKFSIDYPYIKTSFENGKIRLIYYGYKTDERGLPMIVDDINVKEAITEYVFRKLMKIRYYNKSISLNEYLAIEQMSNKKLDKARAMLSMPTPSEFKDLALKWNRLTYDSYISQSKNLNKDLIS